MTEAFGTYRIVSHVKPATVFNRPGGEIILRFPTPDRGYEILTMKELGEKIAENFVPIGLEFRADVQALSIEEALPRGVSLADAVCSFITLVSGVGLPVVRPMLCYELTKGKSEREFRQFFDDAKLPNPSKRVLPHEELIDRIDRLYKVQELQLSERIQRAIRWYRWGTGSTDLYDRFIAYWVGLETLNVELQNRLGVEDDKSSCPNCKYSWAPTKTVSGIREFLKRNFDDGASLYKRMHSLRIELMHGKSRLDQVASETTELAPKTGDALIGAILYLLSINPPWTFPSHTLTNASPFRVLVKAKILSETIEDAFYDHEDPHFKAEHDVIEFSQERQAGGQIKMKVTTRTTAVIGAKAQFRVYGWGIQGEGKGDLSIDSVSK